ncbi:MAG: flagellar hook protein FlgE [Acidobacteriota bacterium]
MNSFFTGLSGLNAQSSSINVIADNLANVNTVGFKGSTARFADLVSGGTRSRAGNPQQEGLGVTVNAVTPTLKQGVLQTTGRPLDIALDGSGFFSALDENGGAVFTRAGDFLLGEQGNLTTSSGYSVLGWQTAAADGAIPASGPVSPIAIPTDLSDPQKSTSSLGVSLNLDGEMATGESFAAPVEIFDSLGARHLLTLNFTKTGTLTWDYDVSIDGGELTGGTLGVPQSIASGTLAFGGDGKLDPATGVDGAAPAPITVSTPTTFLNGATGVNLTWDVLDTNSESRLTAFAAPSVVSTVDQNGFAAGNLTDLQVDSNGVIRGRFSNGRSFELARIAIASFSNEAGLQRLGGNSFATTRSSGEAIFGSPGEGGRGQLLGGALEMSNVDIAEQFTSLILAQRGYQASSRVITTSDEVTQEAINMKR